MKEDGIIIILNPKMQAINSACIFFDIALKTTLELPKNYPKTTLTTLKVLFSFIHFTFAVFKHGFNVSVS